MDLPKNITQIGETNPTCKIYAEDYVISYIKQLNGQALDKSLAVALYGTRREESGVSYLFFYGAARLSFLQRETRHLSQAALQEIEKLRKKYFSQYEFLGYRLLNGEMVEGFHIYEQGVCRYIAGYARFYEKNDIMLNFMLAERREDVKPEEVDQTKYETVKRRQEERRNQTEEYSFIRRREPKEKEPAKYADGSVRLMKMAAAAVFVLLCVAGLGTIDGGERINQLQTAARNMFEQLNDRQLPDAVEVSGSAQVGTIVAEDKLNDAILKENEAMSSPAPGTGEEGSQPSESSAESGVPDAIIDSVPVPDTSSEPESIPDPSAETSPEPESTPDSSAETSPVEETPPAAESAPVSYTIQRGDTLIGICIRKYGSDDKVAEICSLNNISNPDDIKIGQKILLP